MELVDYKVRILTGGTEAVTRVLVESRDKASGERWFTVGVSPNIVDASFEALIDFHHLQAAARRRRGSIGCGHLRCERAAFVAVQPADVAHAVVVADEFGTRAASRERSADGDVE